ncbi:MAG: hypothetical protein H0X64_10960 [Gemmatimonadaceae bacterium]|nr:hypothetical protein [Gemmatimonadaceae bacterium]
MGKSHLCIALGVKAGQLGFAGQYFLSTSTETGL